ncbi:hypothetical protein BDV95DRAFT_46759 [Massariosphaeria phaeospora]|uniref:Uncharacterized protein n=1 Tax=Massariosphaeria phaeospora TaxID=100035 RepID=A0A7C8I611_9PLEO|nr:hypothetical protein BDV95DRAFT_46759 [Massariosphaeria phaeospora]
MSAFTRLHRARSGPRPSRHFLPIITTTTCFSEGIPNQQHRSLARATFQHRRTVSITQIFCLILSFQLQICPQLSLRNGITCLCPPVPPKMPLPMILIRSLRPSRVETHTCVVHPIVYEEKIARLSRAEFPAHVSRSNSLFLESISQFLRLFSPHDDLRNHRRVPGVFA